MSSPKSAPWLLFVKLSMAMALVPGFLMGAAMLAVVLSPGPGGGDPLWYAAARQAHGHAQLIGWGGAMILGVGLHFLPRMRGSRRRGDNIIVPLFWILAAGMVVRVIVPLLALLETGESLSVALLTSGTWIETLGVLGLVTVMAWLLRDGPPLAKKKAFTEMIPMLTVAGVSLLAAMIAWSAGAAGMLWQATSGPILPPNLDSLAVDVASFGFIPAISIGMSARVFPLFFRVPLTRRPLLQASAILLAAGVITIIARHFLPASDLVRGLALILPAAGLAVGTLAVRVFGPRLQFPGDAGRYSTWKEPAALAAASAYIWGLLAAVMLVLEGLSRWGIRLTPSSVPHDLPLHLVGAGFMTLLILGVAPIMLPGFGGAKPAGISFVWAALIAGNGAVLLRILPLIAGTFSSGAGGAAWTSTAFAAAGAAGMAAVACIAVQLWVSLRPIAHAAKS